MTELQRLLPDDREARQPDHTLGDPHQTWSAGQSLATTDPYPDVVDASRTPMSGSPLSRQQLEDLVDQVVDRIEQRVVDELERRGRHLTPGAF